MLMKDMISDTMHFDKILVLIDCLLAYTYVANIVNKIMTIY